MKELLSNEEIDSLLALFRAESGVAPAAPQAAMAEPEPSDDARSAVSPLDLLRPNRIGRDRLQLLERVLATVAKDAAGVLSERLRVDAVCDCVSVEQARFSSWRRQLEGPVGIWTIAAPPFQSSVLLTMTGELLRGAVDRLLGGSGRVARVQEAFTPAEFAIADALVEPLVERIAQSLADVVPLRMRVDGRSGNPAMIQALAPSDVTLAAYFQVGGEVLHGDMRLAIACRDLEPFLERASRDREGVADADRGAASRVVRGVPIRLSAVLGTTGITLRSLLQLRTGDVLRLDRSVGEPIEAEVEGIAKLRGKVARRGSARVLRVEEVMRYVDDEQR